MLTEKISSWLLRPVPRTGYSLQAIQSVALGSDIGLLRKENQDRLAIMTVDSNSPTTPRFTAIALADGMGGMAAGAECAALTIGAFFNALIRHRQQPPETRIKTATDAANSAVFESYNGNGGATLSAVLFIDNQRAYSVNVGDSRIYATQPSSRTPFIRLTIDDSLEEVVGGSGRELLQFIGMGDGLEPHTSPVPDNIDNLLLTSDGVHFIDAAVLEDIALNAQPQNGVIQQLLTYAKWRGAPDNATAACISTKGLANALQFIEPGVEISDAFGSLQVMWVKQEQKDYSTIPKEFNDNPESSTPNAWQENLAPEPKKESKKTPPQKRRPRKLKKDMDVKQTQFEISVEPSDKPLSDKGSDSDIS